MITVKLPDKNVTLNFPDGMSDEEIQAVIKKNYYSQQTGKDESALPNPLKQFGRIFDIQQEEAKSGAEKFNLMHEKPSAKTILPGMLGGLQWLTSPLTALEKGIITEPVTQGLESVGVPESVSELVGETAGGAAWLIPYGKMVTNAIEGARVADEAIQGMKVAKASIPTKSVAAVAKKPLEMPGPVSEKLGTEMAAGGKLSKPVVQETLQKEVADAAIEVLNVSPDEKKRVGQQIVDAIYQGQFDWEGLPKILTKYDITAEEFAIRMKDTYSVAGRSLGRLSIVAKALRKELAKNPEAKKFLDTFIDQMPEPTGWDKFISSVYGIESTRRGLLVTQIATAMRNTMSQGARLTIGSIDDAFQGAIRATVGGEGNILKGLGEGLDHWAAMYSRFSKTGRANLSRILDSEHAALATSRLLGSPVHEVALGNKISKFLNTPNRYQEYFFRKIAFEAKLSQLLKRTGQGIKDIDPAKISSGLLEEATDYALNITFAAMPKNKQIAQFIRGWAMNPIATALVNPFPRFAFGNALPYLYQFSPVSFIHALNPKLVAELATGNSGKFAEKASRAIIGSTQLATALWLRNSGYAGENFYEIKVGDKYFDTRSYAPLISPYLLVAEGMTHPEKLDAADWIQAAVGLNRVAGTALVLTDIIRARKAENVAKTMEKVAGAYLQSFSVPVRTFKDLYGGIDPNENIYRDIRESPISGPFMTNLPGVSQRYPESVSPVKTTPPRTEYPIIRQLTGINTTVKTIIERELSRLTVDPSRIYPRTGFPEIDRKISKFMAPELEKTLPTLIQNKGWSKLPEPIQRIAITRIISEARKKATDRLYQQEPKLAMKVKMGRLEEDKKSLLDIFGAGQAIDNLVK